MSTKQLVLSWVWNAINAFIQGVATAGVASVGIGLAGAAALTQRQTWMVALAGGLIGAFNYVRDNKLPNIFGGGPATLVPVTQTTVPIDPTTNRGA